MRISGMVMTLVLFTSAAAHGLEAGSTLDFIPPPAGSYQLQTIMPAPDGEVLDTSGHAQALSQFTRDKITLLGLIYTRCSDPDGCPRATWAFAEVKRRLKMQRGLAEDERLVSLSFDPRHDTPQFLKTYAANAKSSDRSVEWHFLTTGSLRELMPLLDGFGQDLRVASGPSSTRAEPVFTHTLKVFLIDRQGQVREIYTTAFLMPEMIVNDIKTLLMEDKSAAPAGSLPEAALRGNPRQ